MFERFIEYLGWVRIVIAPFLLGLIIAFIIYLAIPGKSGIALGAFIALAGLIFGIVWANKVARKHGTINFLSKINSSHPKDDEFD